MTFWKNLKKPILALAPMAGVTDRAFRPLVKRFGADVIFTEFASTKALIHGNERTREMIAYESSEQPVVCQLFGNDPNDFSKAAKILESLGFAGVDINFGCPAYKVVTHGGGVAMMREPKRCAEVVAATCDAVSIPVSVKIRSSIKTEDGETKTAIDLVRELMGIPIASLMIHGRSYEKPFDGEPDVDMITAVRAIYDGILIANGGIHTPEDAKKMLDETGADGLGIARGSWGKPWIFQQITDYLNTGTYKEYSWEETVAVILEHAELALQKKDAHGLIELRKHLAWYIKGIPGAAELRSQLVRVKTLDEVKNALMSTGTHLQKR
jgi:tRNA-dihydrouridine synthase B